MLNCLTEQEYRKLSDCTDQKRIRMFLYFSSYVTNKYI
jgi:hypothetical protein